MVTGADLPHELGTREEIAPAVDAAAGPSPAVKGAEIGGVSGLLIGLGALTGPGSLPIVAAGTLLAALGGAAVGAAAGGLVGALVELGVPEEHATLYAAEVARGHVLLAVRTDAALPVQVREIMAQAGALNLYPAGPAPSEASSG